MLVCGRGGWFSLLLVALSLPCGLLLGNGNGNGKGKGKGKGKG